MHVDLFLFSFSFLRTDINLFGEILILILESLSSFIRLYFLIVIYITYFYCRCPKCSCSLSPSSTHLQTQTIHSLPRNVFSMYVQTPSLGIFSLSRVESARYFEVIESVNMSTSKESYIYQFETKTPLLFLHC